MLRTEEFVTLPKAGPELLRYTIPSTLTGGAQLLLDTSTVSPVIVTGPTSYTRGCHPTLKFKRRLVRPSNLI